MVPNVGNLRKNKTSYLSKEVAEITMAYAHLDELRDKIKTIESGKTMITNHQMANYESKLFEFDDKIPQNVATGLWEMIDDSKEHDVVLSAVEDARSPYNPKETTYIAFSYAVLSSSYRKISNGNIILPKEKLWLGKEAKRIVKAIPNTVTDFLEKNPKEIRDSLLSKINFNTIH